MNRGLNEASPNARRWPAFAVAFWMLLGTLLIGSPAHAGSIFDDNWTPPKAAKPAEPPPDAGPSNPPKPPEGARPDTQNTPSAEVAPAPTIAAPPARRPVPTPADQAKSRKLFKEIFATELADRSAAARRALAKKLLAQAATVSDAPSDQFVLLVGAGEAGTEAHDLPLICQAADALGEAYDVDALHVKSDNALKMTFRADTPTATTENIHAGLKLVDQLVTADDYATAARLLYVLRAASSDADLSTQIQSRAKEVDSLRTAAERVAPYLQKLRTSPDDPSANLMVGQYLCFLKDDWKRGLPLLTKGGKTSESAAAALDLAGANDPKKQVAIGDAWWAIGEKEAGLAQSAMRQRAGGWYRMALESNTVSGLTRVLLEKRLGEAHAAEHAVSSAKTFTNTIGMKLIRIEPGEFMMGSPETEAGRKDGETLHHVRITKPFLMAATPVTQAQWKAVMETNPSFFQGDDLPVEQVVWDRAREYCEKLSSKEGKHYRLPTEAEWEYACRAGTQTEYGGSINPDDLGWYSDNSDHHTHPVGLKKPNPWGLYDMHGNVWQWCSDDFAEYGGDAIDPKLSGNGSMHPMRGGSFSNNAKRCRAAFRLAASHDTRANDFGFRVCLDP